MKELHFCIIGEGRPLHHKLKKLGVKMTLFITHDSLKPKDSELYDSIHSFTKNQSSSDWNSIVRNVHAQVKFDRVICVDEFYFDKYKAVVEELDLGNVALKTFEKVSLKHMTKEVLQTKSLDSTRYMFLDDKSNIVKAIEHVGFPLIIKPINGQGSEGVIKFSSETKKEELINSVSSMLSKGDLLIEQFHIGREYSIEILSEEGEHFVFGITKPFENDVTFVETAHCFPAHDLDKKQEHKIREFVKECLNALGVKDGPSHTEVILTDVGEVKFIETHTRCAGDNITELVKLATGFDMLELWAKQLQGENISSLLDNNIKYDKYSAIQFLMPELSGVIDDVVDLNSEETTDESLMIECFKNKGDKIDSISNTPDRIASAICVADSGSKALQGAATGIGNLQFKISCGS